MVTAVIVFALAALITGYGTQLLTARSKPLAHHADVLTVADIQARIAVEDQRTLVPLRGW